MSFRKGTYEVIEFLLDHPFEDPKVIANHFGKSEETVRSSLRKLEEKSYVDKISQKRFKTKDDLRYMINKEGLKYVLDTIKSSYDSKKSKTYFAKYRTKALKCDSCKCSYQEDYKIYRYKNKDLCLSCIKTMYSEDFNECPSCHFEDTLINYRGSHLCLECLKSIIFEVFEEDDSELGLCDSCNDYELLTRFKGRQLCPNCLNPDLSDHPVELISIGNWDEFDTLGELYFDRKGGV